MEATSFLNRDHKNNCVLGPSHTGRARPALRNDVVPIQLALGAVGVDLEEIPPAVHGLVVLQVVLGKGPVQRGPGQAEIGHGQPLIFTQPPSGHKCIFCT